MQTPKYYYVTIMAAVQRKVRRVGGTVLPLLSGEEVDVEVEVAAHSPPLPSLPFPCPLPRLEQSPICILAVYSSGNGGSAINRVLLPPVPPALAAQTQNEHK